VAIFLFVTAELLAQAAGKPYVINFSKSTYGGENQNWSVDIDREGMVYVGNNAGMLEFDGANWYLHRIRENMVVRSVAVGEDNRIYTGSYEEFGYWTRNQKGLLSYRSLSDSLDPALLYNDEIWRIIPLNGLVYFQSFSKIYVYNGKDIRILWPPSSLVLLQRAGDRLFVHVNAYGLYEVFPDSMAYVPGSGFLAHDEIKMVLPAGRNELLVGAAESGLFWLKGEVWRKWNFPAAEIIRNAEINGGLSLNDRFFIGTIVDGLFILDREGNILHHLHTENQLQNNTILALRADRDQNLWVCLDRGVDLVQMNSLIDLYPDRTGRLGSVYAAAMHNHALWIGTNHGLFRSDYIPGRGFTDPVMIPGSNGQVWDLGVFDGELFMGHTRGTFRVYSNNQIEQISDINGGFDLKKITRGDREYLLQTTYSHPVVYTKKDGNWSFSHRVEGLLEPLPRFEIDHLGYIWAVHNQRGVFRIRLNDSLTRPESVKFYDRKNGLSADWKVHVGKINNRVIFLTGHDIQTYDDLQDTIVAHEGLNSRLADYSHSRQVIPAGENRYWFMRDQHAALFHINDRECRKIFEYRPGLRDMYFVSGYSGIEIAADSLFLFCFDNGFAVMHRTSFSRVPPPPEPALRRAHAGSDRGERLSLNLKGTNEPVILPHAMRNLFFQFSSTQTTLFPQYRTRLLGLQKEWTRWSNASSATYTRLQSGHYVFQVQARGISGEESNLTEFPFIIRPPWYRSNLAFLLYGVLLVTGIIALRLLFLHRLRQHALELERTDREKREQEKILAEQRYMKLKNESLEKEIHFKNMQLTNYTYNIINRNKTLIRIKEEILKMQKEKGEKHSHAPYYGRILKLVERNLSSEDDWKIFESHFDEAHQDFFKRLIEAYPELTPSDLKLCAYLRLNLSSKEIAPLLNITVRGVEIRRYRLRKRLKLPKEENLVEFTIRF